MQPQFVAKSYKEITKKTI